MGDMQNIRRLLTTISIVVDGRQRRDNALLCVIVIRAVGVHSLASVLLAHYRSISSYTSYKWLDENERKAFENVRSIHVLCTS